MGWPELVRLGFGAALPAGAMAVGFEGDWLDRFGALLRDRGRWAERQLVLPDPMPRIAYPERLLDHALDLPNAIWRLHGVSTAWARCLLLDPMPRIAYPERLLDHALDLPNAIWRLHGVSTAWARCLLLAFRYTAVS